jgi:O-antigen/teichoic acid export membrane protein
MKKQMPIRKSILFRKRPIAQSNIGELISIRWKKKLLDFLFGTTARKSIVALVDQGVVSAANFFTGIVIGRICAKEQLGLYMLGFTIISFTMNCQGSLITTPYTIYSPRMEGTVLARYTGSSLIHQLALSILITVFLVLGGIFLSLGYDPQGVLPVIKALAAVIMFILFRDYARRVSFASLQIITVLILDCLVSLLQIGGLIIIGYLGLLSASRAYWVLGISCGVVTLFWLFQKRRTFQLSFTQAILDLKRNLSSGKWIFASVLLWSLSSSLYPWFIAYYHGTASAGAWAACLGLIGLCNPFLMGLQNTFRPKIAHEYAKGGAIALGRFVVKASSVFGITIGSFCIGIFLYGGVLIEKLYGSKYSGNGLIVALLAFNLLITSMAFSPSRALFTIERADIDFKINLCSVLGLFTVGIILIKYYGSLGAAIGILVSSILCLIFLFIAFYRLVILYPKTVVKEAVSNVNPKAENI